MCIVHVPPLHQVYAASCGGLSIILLIESTFQPSSRRHATPLHCVKTYMYLTHPSRLSEAHAGVLSGSTKLGLNAEKLVVLGRSLATAGSSGLDLASAKTNSEIGDVVVLGLSRSVAGHDAPSVLLGKLDGIDRLGDGTDLVDLKEQAVGRSLLNGLLDLNGVGDGEVVANNLNLLSDLAADLGPVVPIVLVKGILNGDDGVLVAKLLVEGNHLITSEHEASILVGASGLEVKIIVVSLDHELRGGNVKTDGDLVEVSSSLGGLHDHLKAGLNIAGRGEATLVTDESSITTELALDNLLEVVENLAANNHGLAVYILFGSYR